MENEKRKWIDRLKDTYRLVIMNDETFEEMGSYKLTMLNFYILLSTIVVTVAFIAILLIAFTPLRRYVPGYGDYKNDQELVELNRELVRLKKELTAQQAYTENIRKILVGNVETEEDVEQTEPQDFDTAQRKVEPSEIDQQLRREVELQKTNEIVRSGKINTVNQGSIPLEQIYFVPPLTGTISAGYMPDKKHYGVDVLAPKNTAVKAALDGYVFLSDWTLETGNTIGIQHANNIITFYKHNSALLKKAGSRVKAGEAIAIIGNTGTFSNGPHLHFELWYKGKTVNPTDYIMF